ncbi:MAG: STAS domain-containing protein [Rhizomicrobium sp.]
MKNLDALSAASEGGRQLTLPENAGADTCPAMKQEMLQALADEQNLRVDAGAVKSIGTPMMQLLVAAKRAFAGAGGSGMLITQKSERFLEVEKLLGLSGILDGSEY